MTSNTNTSKKGIPAISVISDPLSREVLFLSVLKWFFFLLSCKIIYHLLDCRNAMELFYLKGRQLMYAVINSPLGAVHKRRRQFLAIFDPLPPSYRPMSTSQ